MKTRILITALIVHVGSFLAQAGETYKFDQAHSRITFTVHQYLGTTHGKFTKFEGKIEVDREHPEKSSVVARIQVNSIDTGIVNRDNHLKSEELFNAPKFPEISFKSRSVRRTGPESGDILGDLTMHGVTRPVTLQVKLLTPSKETKQTRWSVTTDPLKRSDFNLEFSQTSETVSGIGQSVAVEIEIEAMRAE